MRRFNTTTVNAKEFDRLANKAAIVGTSFCERAWSQGEKSPQNRAIHVLLHWWAVGHDPARHLLRCTTCKGRGVVPYIQKHFPVDCFFCKGTGRDEGKKL